MDTKEEKIREDRGILGNALSDLKNFITGKNAAGKAIRWWVIGNVVFGSALSIIDLNPTPFFMHVVNGLVPAIPYFFGSIGKNIRRAVMPDNAINRLADEIDDYLDEPVDDEKEDGEEYSLTDADREFIKRL